MGKASAIVVTLFLLSALEVMKHFYAQGVIQFPRDRVLALLAQSFTALSLFVLFYVIAVMKRRKLHHHVAFMVAASLAAATPGLARLGLYVVGATSPRF